MCHPKIMLPSGKCLLLCQLCMSITCSITLRWKLLIYKLSSLCFPSRCITNIHLPSVCTVSDQYVWFTWLMASCWRLACEAVVCRKWVQSAGFSYGVTILSELASAGGVQPVSLRNPLCQVPVTKCQLLFISPTAFPAHLPHCISLQVMRL
jgi:hypothetical protein